MFELKIKIEKEMCLGCGLCCELCPSCFKMDYSLEKAIINTKNLNMYNLDEMQSAITNCPVEAIMKY